MLLSAQLIPAPPFFPPGSPVTVEVHCCSSPVPDVSPPFFSPFFLPPSHSLSGGGDRRGAGLSSNDVVGAPALVVGAHVQAQPCLCSSRHCCCCTEPLVGHSSLLTCVMSSVTHENAENSGEMARCLLSHIYRAERSYVQGLLHNSRAGKEGVPTIARF